MATRHKRAKATDPSYRSSKPDYYPVQRTIPLGVDGGNLSGTVIGDCGRLLSQTNRRLYRQGKLYQAKVDMDLADYQAADGVKVDVYVLANTWDTQRAWALAKATYDAAYSEEIASMQSSQIARWRDFRVQHGITGATVANSQMAALATLADQVVTAGEFVDSIVDVNGTSKTFTWSNVISPSTLNMVQEWDKAGSVDTSPAVSSNSAPYEDVNPDSAETNEMTQLAAHGNLPPYDQSNPNGRWVKVASLFQQTPSGKQKLSTGFFDAPCGLVALVCSSALSNGDLSITVKGGDYKGTHALSMGA